MKLLQTSTHFHGFVPVCVIVWECVCSLETKTNVYDESIHAETDDDQVTIQLRSNMKARCDMQDTL